MNSSGFATIPLPWTTVYANSTTQRSFPASGWMSAGTFSKVKGDFEMRERISDIEVSLGYETANVENGPGMPETIGSFKTTDDVHYGTGWSDISTDTDGKTLFRIVWLTKNTSGSSITMARVGGSVKGIKKS